MVIKFGLFVIAEDMFSYIKLLIAAFFNLYSFKIKRFRRVNFRNEEI